MLDEALKTQLASHLGLLQVPIELVATLDESEAAGRLRGLLQQIVGLSPKISLREDGTNPRTP
ncbi:MAG: alkyl hydroperoxide reductase subunit F, partial [Candidatus Sericytochromatia bacterium]|nr:alkyl hydroperoxide reductase subunit F [Candidatus Sericytochromatia bacterium]